MAKIWIEGASADGSITILQCSELLHNLSAIDNRSSEISNHNFVNVQSLGKLTTSSNECRHKSIKYGTNHVQPNNQLVTSVIRILSNTRDAMKLDMVNIANDTSTSCLWNNFDINVHAGFQIFILGQWNAK